MKRIRVIIMGAAGRDFHNFNVFFRSRENYEVIAFTATQIPNIEQRRYPPELTGPLYPEGIPIYPEEALWELIAKHDIDQVIFSYSDVTHENVMHLASRALACGADFRLMGPNNTLITSTKPVIAVCAVRTGVGKSQTTRKVCQVLKNLGKKAAVIRHPMPYGDLAKQICQRYGTYEDLNRHDCTIEEREEYEPHIQAGNIVYAGVDYEQILREAEKEADIIIWDGGNNDLPFYKPDLHLVLVDPHRLGHETRYYPGESNLLMADVIIINKMETAPPDNVKALEENVKRWNPGAQLIRANSPVEAEDPGLIKGKRVLVVEDGPTITHGEMSFGAGIVAARQYEAAEIVDPRPYTVRSIREVYIKYPHIGAVLPAMGYGEQQMKELQKTINNTPCDTVVIGTPIDLRRVINIDKPAVRITYRLEEQGKPDLTDVISKLFSGV